jgi:hypothetical protein
MKWISRVSCPDGAEGCDYAMFDLSPALAKLALERVNALRDLKRLDGHLYETRYWDYHAEYFSPWAAQGECCGDALAEEIEKSPAVAGDWMEAPADIAIPESLVAGVECCRMVVMDDGIFFAAILKHTDFTVSTGELPLGAPERAAQNRLA